MERKVLKKDLPRLKSSQLHKKFDECIKIMKNNPFENPPVYEKLLGDLDRFYSRRLNIQHQLIYTVDESEGIVRIYSAWGHDYDKIKR